MATKRGNSLSGKALKVSSFDEKEKIVKRLNERIASIVRKTGLISEEYSRWASKLTRPRSPYASKVNTYRPENVQLDKNKGDIKESLDFIQLSRKKADIEKMSLEDLERLESQTRGWGAVRKEAKAALMDQRRKEIKENPFLQGMKPAPVSDADISDYLVQKEKVRQFIEGNTDAFYALIEATGWDDILQHTTEEVYAEISKINMNTYKFSSTLDEIGEDYKQRRDASRARRKALGIL